MQIIIKYEPVPKRRRNSTNAISQALMALQSNPLDESGTPGWFQLDKKYAQTARSVAKELGISARVEVFEDHCRVRLKRDAEDDDPNQLLIDDLIDEAAELTLPPITS